MGLTVADVYVYVCLSIYLILIRILKEIIILFPDYMFAFLNLDAKFSLDDSGSESDSESEDPAEQEHPRSVELFVSTDFSKNNKYLTPAFGSRFKILTAIAFDKYMHTVVHLKNKISAWTLISNITLNDIKRLSNQECEYFFMISQDTNGYKRKTLINLMTKKNILTNKLISFGRISI
jgi:hypothetical protein